MDAAERHQPVLPKALLLAFALGVLPHLVWATLGFAGGLFVATVYPAVAGYLGWTIHRTAPDRCARLVTICAAVAAFSFTGLFFASGSELSHFYTPMVLAAGGVAVFVGALLAAAVFISLGVSARQARVA